MGRSARPFLAALAFACALSGPAFAGSLSSAQQAGLEATLAAFSKATEAHDPVAIVNLMPPGMILKLAVEAGASQEAMRKALADKLASLSERVNRAEFALDASTASEGTAADGTAYAIVPTKMKFELKDGTNVKTRGKTFAFEQEGHWFLVALTDDTIRQDFYDAYPQFKSVDISLSSLKSQGN